MRFRFGLPFLFLFATPLFAGVGAAAPVLRPGSLKIAVDPAAVSFLPIDAETLKLNLCSGLPPDDWDDPLSPRAECDLSVSPPPGITLFVDAFAVGGNWRVSLKPERSTAWKGSAPVATSCGLWDVSMGLDPDKTQPVSELALERSAADPAQGVFSGVVKLAVRYRFVNRDDDTSYELPTVVPLELSGHWAAVPADGPSLGATASNLVLYAGVVDGVWQSFTSCGTWGGTRCAACFNPPPDVLDTLSPSLHP